MLGSRFALVAPSAATVTLFAPSGVALEHALIDEVREAIAAGQLRRAIAVIDRLAAEDRRRLRAPAV